MPSPEQPTVEQLGMIARRICQALRVPAPATLTPDALRALAAENACPESQGLCTALVYCVEEMIAAEGWGHVLRALGDYAERMDEPPAVLLDLWKRVHDLPYAFSDPRILVLRAPPKTRIAKALGTSLASPGEIASVVEPLPDESRRSTFQRAMARGMEQMGARQKARSQARGTVRSRMRSQSADEYFVLASKEGDARELLRAWGRKNGYGELIDDLTPIPSGKGR
jgi:hypothetical protein